MPGLSRREAGTGPDGNALRMQPGPGAVNLHLAGLLDGDIVESDRLVVVEFELLVPSAAQSGGAIHVGGDHGGGGTSAFTDRGPQMARTAGGPVIVANSGGGAVPVLATYPIGEWQSVRLEIDLAADSWDLLMGFGEEPQPVATDLEFRSGTLEFLDRFTVAYFSGPLGPSDGLVDDVRVFQLCPGDFGENGAIDFGDVVALVAAWGFCAGCPEDLDGDFVVDFDHLVALLSDFGPCD